MKNPWGVLGLVFAGYVLLWPIMDPILVTFGQICNFRKLSQLSHFNFCFYELTHSLLNEEHVTFPSTVQHGVFTTHNFGTNSE